MNTTPVILSLILVLFMDTIIATPIHPRAGGPAILPIPPTCKISNPLSSLPPTRSYLPRPSTSTSLLYSAYYPSFSSNTTLMAEQCLQQCYGYGSHTECKAAYWAEDMRVPKSYDGVGGQLMTACLMFTRDLESVDFEEATEGQGKGATAGNLEC